MHEAQRRLEPRLQPVHGADREHGGQKPAPSKPGDKCPEFALTDAEGRLIRSQDLIAQGPVVLSFYRGVWCPFCSAELEALHAAEAAIKSAGARLVAVSAEAGGLSLRVKHERKFGFDIPTGTL